MTPIILDTDPGVDDAMAILYAMADPEVELVGLTTIFGNVPVATATRNALALTELAGHDCPVAEGVAVPLVQAPHAYPDFVHGVNGFGEAVLPLPARSPDPRSAWQFMEDAIAARPGEITLVPVGPLTNLALLLERAPEVTSKVARVVVMGGAVRTPGNVTPSAEANIWQDPHAAAKVLSADWPVTMVGLDVTERIHCYPADLEPMIAASPQCGAFLAKAADFYFEFHRRQHGLDGSHLHDPTAVIAALQPELFETVSSPVTVTLDGENGGRTRETDDIASPAVTICIEPNAEAIRARFLQHLHSGQLP